ncbi:probable serine/threonine-protein kinase PBL15 [Selaginella moellendorffii]|nr:probable serine/threonine-protein kinase PBL15 [Selaginella moellendorffii]|eukprot:XP_002986684.2 probable serine/threonine-protein kinase PBL15 [Selaginella moellendorffii]
MTTIAHSGAKNLAASVSILGSIILVPPVLVSLFLSRLTTRRGSPGQSDDEEDAAAALELEIQAQQQLWWFQFQEFAMEDVAVNLLELQEPGRVSFHGCLRLGPDSMQEVSIRKLELTKAVDLLTHLESAEIRQETVNLGSLRRCNVLPLLGFSLTHSYLLLFMPKLRSLTDVLRNSSLSWSCRCRVAALVARGLSRLHYSREAAATSNGPASSVVTAVLHGNIRSENVHLLLEEATDDSPPTCTPYIADTGFVKLTSMPIFRPDEMITNTRGYAAPEVSSGGALTTKSEVYSFGVVLCVLLSGQTDVAALNPVALLKQKLKRLMDPKLEKSYNGSQARTIQQTALKCIQRDPMQRPDMIRVEAWLRSLLLHT